MQADGKGKIKAFRQFRQQSGSLDAKIDLQEFKRALKFAGMNVGEKVAKEVFHKFDTDGSGEIDYNEFSLKLEAPSQSAGRFGAHRVESCTNLAKNREELKLKRKGMLDPAAFGAIDIDGDGVIDAHEIALASKLRQQGYGASFGHVDSLSNGSQTMREKQMHGRKIMVDELRHKYQDRFSLKSLVEHGHQLKTKQQDTARSLISPTNRSRNVRRQKTAKRENDDTVANKIVNAPNFGQVMNMLKTRARKLELKSSVQMRSFVQGGLSKQAAESVLKDVHTVRIDQKQRERRVIHQATSARVAEVGRPQNKFLAFMKQHNVGRIIRPSM